MAEIKRKNNTLKLYCCGGAATNVGLLFEPQRGQTDTPFANIDISYLDTSDSNFENGESDNPEFQSVPDSSIYLFSGLKGSGAIRSENNKEVASRVKEILQHHKPGDFNIVISSMSGGSGSVIAPTILRELLTREVPVLVISIGNTSNSTYASNTRDTLKSYDLIAARRNAGVVMAYFDNDVGRKKVNQEIYDLILSLSVLFSGRNRELDSKDLENFLRFDRVPACQAEPQLMILTTLERDSKVPQLGNVATVATLAIDPDDADFTYNGVEPPYQCIGFLTGGQPVNVKDVTPYHFVVSDGPVTTIFNAIANKIKQQEEAAGARVKRASILSDADLDSDDDIVV